jgi:hypothetical protein
MNTPRALQRRIRTTAVVTLTTGDAFRGIVWDVDRALVVLRDSQLIDPRADSPQVVDGEVLLAWERIAYIQIIGGGPQL